MNLAIIVLSVVVPLLPLVLWPARTIGRGGAWKYIGAAVLVGLMMIVFLGVQDLGGDTGSTDQTAAAGISDADIAALEKILK
jgi:hypothetical protein